MKTGQGTEGRETSPLHGVVQTSLLAATGGLSPGLVNQPLRLGAGECACNKQPGNL